MPTRPSHVLPVAAAALLTCLGAAPPAFAGGGANWHLVHPGESIQQAVDAARPGDGVLVLPGTYRESVRITTPHLTLRGLGPGTVLAPAEQRAGEPAPAPAASCAAAGHGICVDGTPAAPLLGVTVADLTVRGYPKNGIDASGTDGLVVRGVHALDNGQQGISQEKSVRAVVQGNVARGNGQAGVFLANAAYEEGGAIDTRGTVIGENELSGNRLGVVVRRARELTVEHNEVHGNCGGVFVIGDENVPRAGALTVRRNHVHENNKYCPPNPRLAFIQGSGIMLTGAEDTRVTENRVEGNTGTSPMSGGIVLLHSLVGSPNARISVTDNLALNNGPADLADRDTGPGNTFTGNTCGVSEPAGHC
ncbi:right-handed parallel beta-helix repeat-containing protein [Kitasatospora sp. NPDC002227]|uniref:right-handed parallel beta-helix repeat-containing protein n=1 Tax=Kitasatospora sp. NPDC002227 TaxID=3154773 RepID=UPI00332A1A62